MRSTTFVCMSILLLCVSLPVIAGSAQTLPTCSDDGTQVSYFYLNVPFCDLELPITGFAVVSVWVLTTPITKARLSIPDPPVGTIDSEVWNFPHTGDRTTGIELDLGGCSEAGAIQLGTLVLTYLPFLVTGCPTWRIDDGAEVDYCTGETGPGLSFFHSMLVEGGSCPFCPSWQWCPTLPPQNLFPADGAIEVPLDVELTCVDYSLIRITDDPTCASWQQFTCTGSGFSPDFLQPNTTYYWQIVEDLTGSGCSVGHDTRTAIHSFTTIAPMPVEGTTWGAIKSLYQ